MKLNFLQFYQFRLVSMGRSRKGRKGMLHWQHDSPCVLRIVGNKTQVLIHAQFPMRQST